MNEQEDLGPGLTQDFFFNLTLFRFPLLYYFLKEIQEGDSLAKLCQLSLTEECGLSALPWSLVQNPSSFPDQLLTMTLCLVQIAQGSVTPQQSLFPTAWSHSEYCPGPWGAYPAETI